MEDILYVYGENLYINLTNECPCKCVFCIRSQKDGLGTAETLWLEHAPSAAEVIAAFQNYRLADFDEVIFCGYGEPMCELDSLLTVCQFLREQGNVKIRLNTNGLGDLINRKPTAPLLAGAIDAVSISLNAPDAQSYNALCRPVYGMDAFDAILAFSKSCKQYLPAVTFSVVDVIPAEKIERCKTLALQMEIPLRIRHFTD